jgi:hypothetical protein
MSGETEERASAWTTDTLRDFLIRLLDSKFETVDQRFADMDKATELLSATVNRVPTDLQTAINEVLRLMDERDHRVQDQFHAIHLLRQTQYELNQQAVKDALAAQKESTGVSYSSLDRTIEKNAELASQQNDALGARVTQVSEMVIRTQQQIAEILAGTQAIVAQKVDTRGSTGTLVGIVGAVVGMLAFVMTIILTVTRL